MSVNQNIGLLRRAIDYANRVPSLVNINPILDPNIPFNSELLELLTDKDDPNAVGMFTWGIDKWGDNTKKVTKI